MPGVYSERSVSQREKERTRERERERESERENAREEERERVCVGKAFSPYGPEMPKCCGVARFSDPGWQSAVGLFDPAVQGAKVL